MKILNFGSFNIDYVYAVEHIAKPGETISSLGLSLFCGGKGFNQSVALARAGAPVYHAGMVGADGGMLLEACDKHGIDRRHVKTVSERTGNAVIQVESGGQNCIVLFGGANLANTEQFIDSVLDCFDGDDLLLLQNEINLIDSIIEKAYKKKMVIALNPSPFDKSLLGCGLEKVSIFIMNEIEGFQLTGENEPAKILDKMSQVYPAATVALTLGERGVVCRRGTETHNHGIYKLNAIDTTAAGDTFTGFFLAQLMQKSDIPQCLKTASAASAIAVSRNGASDSIPTLAEVMEARLEDAYRPFSV